MKYDWKDAGEEWSAPWGTSAVQWEHAILPRVRDYLPTGTILEIAPGFGRWTHYLKECCRELWIVDRIEECIEACRERFAADSHVRCYVNDGRSLSIIPGASVDFVFSFDSLVHTKISPTTAIADLRMDDLRFGADLCCFAHEISVSNCSRGALFSCVTSRENRKAIDQSAPAPID